MIKMKRNKETFLFTILLVTFPILNMYQTGISSIMVGDLFLILISPLLVFNLIRKNQVRIDFPLFLLFLFILVYSMIIVLFVNSSDQQIFGTTLRYLVYLLTLSIFVKEFFSWSIGYKYLEIIAIAASIFMIIQTVLYNSFNFYLPGNIPFLKLDILSLQNITDRYNQGLPSRLTSFFAEPAHFSTYVLLYLFLLLVRKDVSVLKILIVSLALLLSQSSLGIIMLLLICFISSALYIKKQYYIGRTDKIISLILVCIIAFMIIINTKYFGNFLNRTFGDSGLGSATLGRFGNYDKIRIKSFKDLIGYGIRPLDFYIPGLPRIMNFLGVFGMAVYLYLFAVLIYKNKGNNMKWLVLFFIILNIGSEILFGNFILIYFPWIISYNTFEKGGN